MSALSRSDLARVPRWAEPRTCALVGRCRGKLLGPWGPNLARRFGPDAVARVRSRLPGALTHVSPHPSPSAWVPAVAQICLTEAIADEFLAGDVLALYPLLVEDTRRASNRAALALLRRLGPVRMFKMAPRSQRRLYDLGSLDARVEAREATLTFRGAALFGHPTWRLLQVMAQETLLELMEVRAVVTASASADDTLLVRVTW